MLLVCTVVLGSHEDNWKENKEHLASTKSAEVAVHKPEVLATKMDPTQLSQVGCSSSCASQKKSWLQMCQYTECNSCAACSQSINELIQTSKVDVGIAGMGVHLSPKLIILFPLGMGVLVGAIHLLVAKS